MSVTWYDNVTITVEIAFTTDPQDPAPAWTDVSAYVRDIPNLSVGRNSEFTKFSPSTCTFVLGNADRRFDPEYASSPYVGNLLPMKKIRWRCTYAAVTYDMFTGYIQGWPQAYSGIHDSTVTITAVDGSRFLEQAILPLSTYSSEVTADSPMHYWPLQDEALTDIVADRTLTGTLIQSYSADRPLGETTMLSGTPSQPSYPDSNPINGYTSLTADSYLASAPRAFECWLLPRTLYTVLTVASSALSYIRVEIHFSGDLRVTFENAALSRWSYIATGVFPSTVRPTHVAVTTSSTDITVYVNGLPVYTEVMTVGSPGLNTPAIGTDLRMSVIGPLVDAVSHVSVYSTALTEAQVSAHYSAGIEAHSAELSGARVERVLDDAGWPSAARDLSDGNTIHGAYLPAGQSAMSMLRAIETAEDGYLFIDGSGNVVLRDRNWQWTAPVSATFTDDGTGVYYSVIVIDANTVDAIRNKVSATYGPNNAYAVAEDTASRDAYGPATEALSVPTIDEATTARGLATYKLRVMKDPQTRIASLVSHMREQPTVGFPVVLGMQIGDRIEVERRPQSVGSAIVKSLTVQGYSHSLQTDEWQVTVYLSPSLSADDAPYLTLGHVTLGRIGAAAGNHIPF